MLHSRRALLALLASFALSVAPLAAQDCGSFWTGVYAPPPGPGSHHLHGMAGLGASEAWAVGSQPDASGGMAALALHLNGEQWTPVPLAGMPPGSQLNGVAERASNDVWAVGGDGHAAYAAHFDGAAWSVQPLPRPANFEQGVSASDVLALAAGDVWAVGWYDSGSPAGQYRTAVWHWNGQFWSVVPSPCMSGAAGNPLPSTLASIATAGPGALVAVGEWRDGSTWYPLAMLWNGAGWSLLQTPASANGDGRLRSVSATSLQDIWAVGTSADKTPIVGGGYAQAFALHFDGTAWTEVPVQQPSPWGINPLSAVLAGPEGVHAAGSWENPAQGLDSLILRHDGHGFVVVASTNLPGDGEGWNELRDLAHVGGATWAVGDGSVSFDGWSLPLVEQLVSPCAGSVSVAGTGTPGCAGPLLIAASSVPSVGNKDFTVALAGLAPSAPALLLLGNAVDPSGSLPGDFGALVHINLAASTILLPMQFLTGPDGGIGVPFPVPANPQLAGKTFVLQAFSQWSAGACQITPSGWSSSPALVLTIQP